MRLDVYLSVYGLAESRNKARQMIKEGIIYVNGKQAMKLSADIVNEDVVTLHDSPMPYVSRGGVKLNEALCFFKVNIQDKIAVDIGSSTGGFTDCLLKHSAKKVYAVDSGRGQLHSSLLSDSRVVLLENTNARYISYDTVGEYCDIVVMDVSFISQTLIYTSVDSIMKKDGTFISLIKPQFEAGRTYIGKNGIVKDSAVHESVIKDIIKTAQSHNLYCSGVICSPITGGDGNREYLALFTRQNNMDIDDMYIKKLVYGL